MASELVGFWGGGGLFLLRTACAIRGMFFLRRCVRGDRGVCEFVSYREKGLTGDPGVVTPVVVIVAGAT